MADTMMTRLMPGEGRRVVLPAGCLALDGLPLARGATMPAKGAQVPRGVWASRVAARGDAVPVPDAPAKPTAGDAVPVPDAPAKPTAGDAVPVPDAPAKPAAKAAAPATGASA